MEFRDDKTGELIDPFQVRSALVGNGKPLSTNGEEDRVGQDFRLQARRKSLQKSLKNKFMLGPILTPIDDEGHREVNEELSFYPSSVLSYRDMPFFGYDHNQDSVMERKKHTSLLRLIDTTLVKARAPFYVIYTSPIRHPVLVTGINPRLPNQGRIVTPRVLVYS